MIWPRAGFVSCSSARSRATTAASPGVDAPLGATSPVSPRANSNRPSGESRLSYEPAHHTIA